MKYFVWPLIAFLTVASLPQAGVLEELKQSVNLNKRILSQRPSQRATLESTRLQGMDFLRSPPHPAVDSEGPLSI